MRRAPIASTGIFSTHTSTRKRTSGMHSIFYIIGVIVVVVVVLKLLGLY